MAIQILQLLEVPPILLMHHLKHDLLVTRTEETVGKSGTGPKVTSIIFAHNLLAGVVTWPHLAVSEEGNVNQRVPYLVSSMSLF